MAAAAVAVAAVLAACGGGSGGGSTAGDATTASGGTTPATATGPAATQPAATASGPSHDVTLWFVKDGKPASVTRTAPQTREVARQSLELLLAGPTAEERAQGYSTQIADGTRLNGIALRDHVATVDLSSGIQGAVTGAPEQGAAAQLKLGQIVRTLQQFADLAWVRFAVNGAEQTFPAPGDGLYAGLLNREIVDAGKDGPPWIRIDAVGVDGHHVHVAGTADVFEGALTARLVQHGRALVTSPVQASCGTGCRGSYAVDLAAPPGATGPVRLELSAESAEDGSVADSARRDITLG